MGRPNMHLLFGQDISLIFTFQCYDGESENDAHPLHNQVNMIACGFILTLCVCPCTKSIIIRPTLKIFLFPVTLLTCMHRKKHDQKVQLGF